MRESRQWFFGGLAANVILLTLSVVMFVPLSWTELVVLDNTEINVTNVYISNSSAYDTFGGLTGEMGLSGANLPLKYQLHLWGYASLGENDEVIEKYKVSRFNFSIPSIYSKATISGSNVTFTEQSLNLPLSRVNLRDLAESAQNIRDVNLTILIISCLSFTLQCCGLIFESSVVLAVIGAFVSILMSLIATLLGLIECLGAHLALGTPIVKHFSAGDNLTGITASKSDLVYIPMGFMVPMGCLLGVLAFTGFTFNIGYARSK